MSLEPGSTFGRFEVLEQIGSGGMGAVYRARDPRLGRQVALKVLHAQDEQARTDILHEARAAARIEHPNAVLVFDADEVDGVPYIAMELIQGTSLRGMIGREGISIETKVAWLLGIARALAAAHAKGIVHRDLKPENVMIREDGIVKVLDFGIAARMPEVDRSAETGTLEEGGGDGTPGVWAGAASVKGTVAYCAPEQLRGERIDARADQFSWGVLAYEVIAGMRPFQGEALAELLQAICVGIVDIQTLCAAAPEQLCAVVGRALEKDRTQRFSLCADLVLKLEELHSVSPSNRRGRTNSRASLSAKLAWWLASTVALVGLTVTYGRIATSASSPRAHTRPAPIAAEDSAAARTFRAGVATLREGSGAGAARYFHAAVLADPFFGPAQLQLLALTGVGSAASREQLQLVREARSSLSGPEQELLSALEDASDGSPSDAVIERRLLERIARAPNVAVLWLQLARTLAARSHYVDAILAFDTSLRLDPGLGIAAAERAQSFLFLDDVAAGRKAYDECIAAFPASTSCISARIGYANSDGEKEMSLELARKLVALAPELPESYVQLANAIYDDGSGRAEAGEALRTAERLLTGAQRAVATLRNSTSLAILDGDFVSAQKYAKRWSDAVVGAHDAWVHTKPAITRMNIALEIGDRAEASAISYELLKSLPGWHDDFSSNSIFALRGLYWSGAVPRGQFVQARNAWVDDDRRVQERDGTAIGMSWIIAYVQPSLTRDDAEAALRAFADYPSVPNRVNRGLHYEGAVGELYRLVGDTRRAISSLQRGATSGEATSFPLEYGWANLHLAQALEANGELRSACARYARVLALWGAHLPASVSAQIAKRRFADLRCARIEPSGPEK